MSEPFVPLEFESEYVVGAYGTAYRAIEVFRTGEMQGTHNERLRIIKLLEDEELHTHPNNTMANYDKLVWEGIKEQLIALIKGEQK